MGGPDLSAVRAAEGRGRSRTVAEERRDDRTLKPLGKPLRRHFFGRRETFFRRPFAATPEATMTLSADERRALAMLATSGRDGVAQAWLSAHGFDATMIAGLVSQGMATITAEKVRADGKLVAVAKVRITEAGQNALMAKG
jgi:hypothetical protein